MQPELTFTCVVGNPRVGSRTLRAAAEVTRQLADAARASGATVRDTYLDLAEIAPHLFDWESATAEAWIAQALTPTTPQPTYGFMNYFLNTGKRQWPSAPESTFCHLGNGTNAVCVLPDYDMVVVLRWIRPNAVDGALKRVIQAVR